MSKTATVSRDAGTVNEGLLMPDDGIFEAEKAYEFYSTLPHIHVLLVHEGACAV